MNPSGYDYPPMASAPPAGGYLPPYPPPYPPASGFYPMQPMGMGGPVTTQPMAGPPNDANYIQPPMPVPAPFQHENIAGPIGGHGSFGGHPNMPQQPGYMPYPGSMPQNPSYGQGPVGPPGLECLYMLDRVIIKQKVEMLEAIVGFETNNKYLIRDVNKRELFSAKESTDCCTRNMCGAIRPFELKIKDTVGQEVIHVDRPLACDSCLCPCWLQSVDVYAPVNVLAGRVVQQWSMCNPSFRIEDDRGNALYSIEGPTCTWSLCGDVDFTIRDMNGTDVARISKNWSGIAREALTDADNFTVTFPPQMDLKMKAVLIGAAFLLDFMFFEKKGNRESDGIGMLS